MSRIATRALQDFVVAESEESLPEESTKGKLWKLAAKCLRSKWFANFIVAIAAFICIEHRICDIFFLSVFFGVGTPVNTNEFLTVTGSPGCNLHMPGH